MEHGTTAGYYRHLRAKTPTCEPCRKAMHAKWDAYRAKRKAEHLPRYNERGNLEQWRSTHKALERAIKAGWNGTPTKAQRKLLDTWYERAWGLATPPTINE